MSQLAIKTVITVGVSPRDPSLSIAARTQRIVVTTVSVGLTGAPASAGQAQISTDPNNALIVGGDGRLYVGPPHLSSAQW